VPALGYMRGLLPAYFRLPILAPSLKIDPWEYISQTQLNTSPTSPPLSSPLLSLLSAFAMAATAPPTTTGSAKLDGLVQTAAAKEPQKLSGLGLYSRFVRLRCHVFGRYDADNLRPSLVQFAAQ
jgi:hypothetical protein